MAGRAKHLIILLRTQAGNPMTDTDAKNPPAESAVASRRAKTASKKSENDSRHGRVRGGLAVILATLALIASGYLWYVMFHESADLFSRKSTRLNSSHSSISYA